MENKLDLILNKLEKIEQRLCNVKDDTIEEFLSDVDYKTFIGVNANLIYEVYKNNTKGNATKREFNNAVKKTFGLRLKHTTKNKENIYYWGE